MLLLTVVYDFIVINTYNEINSIQLKIKSCLLQWNNQNQNDKKA